MNTFVIYIIYLSLTGKKIKCISIFLGHFIYFGVDRFYILKNIFYITKISKNQGTASTEINSFLYIASDVTDVIQLIFTIIKL